MKPKPRHRLHSLAALRGYKWVNGRLEPRLLQDMLKEFYTDDLVSILLPSRSPLERLIFE